MTTDNQSWAKLRQQARQLESQTESLFSTYSQYASVPNIPAKPTADETRTESQIADIFSERETTISSLTRLLESDPQPSALKSSHLTRHRETLLTHHADYNRLKAQLSSARDRANLLSSVRHDISAYRAANTNPASQEADYMLDERARLDNSNNMADRVLAQAYAVNESFGIQREQLESVRRRITGVVGQVPGINGLMARIGTKKRRDGVILASFMAFCCLMFLYFL